MHAVVKNALKRQNEEIQIGTTHRILHQKQQAPNRAVQSTKTSVTAQKKIAETSLTKS